MILNLVINGMEALTAVTDRRRELTIRSGRQGDAEVRIEIEDTGAGIDAKNMDHLFGAFFTTKSDGMGMGLSISRSIIEAHGGRIWATRNPAGGATFQFTLPALPESAP